MHFWSPNAASRVYSAEEDAGENEYSFLEAQLLMFLDLSTIQWYEDITNQEDEDNDMVSHKVNVDHRKIPFNEAVFVHSRKWDEPSKSING